jgi:hypothetical protein
MGGWSVLLCVAVAPVSPSWSNERGLLDHDGKARVVRTVELRKEHLDRIKQGMTLKEVQAILGRQTAINPHPAPFAYGGAEVLVLWLESPEKWLGVIFVPSRDRVLRVLPTPGTYLGYRGL